MQVRSLLCITVLWASHPLLHAQAVTIPVTPPVSQQNEAIPVARPVPQQPTGEAVRLEADEQRKDGPVYTLRGKAVVRLRDFTLQAETIVYNNDTGIATVPGAFQLDGGADSEHIRGDRAEINLRGDTAHFYNVTGAVTIARKNPGNIYGSGHPFLFTAHEVVKQGPAKYIIYNGRVTSCDLPRPDWDFQTSRAEIDGDSAKLYSAAFRLLNIPILFFPYATHALDVNGRQTGFLIPTFGTSSSKGTILGEEFYWAINRSTDLTLGLDYYSLRGFAERGVFHYRGEGLDFARITGSALEDRGQPGTGINQGGQDILVSGRHDFSPETRVAGDIEYLSSYTYREAFAENFTSAVNSEVKSSAYLVHNQDGTSLNGLVERYQNFEGTEPGDEIRILHMPSLVFDSVDHNVGAGFFVRADASADGLRRAEPGFATGGITERVSLHPELGWNGFAHGWSARPRIEGYETFYSRSQTPGAYNTAVGYVVPVERSASLNRSAGEFALDLDAPAIERDYSMASGSKLRHVLEPSLTYRYVTGVRRFEDILRFDELDLLSDTNEAEYGLTQRLFHMHKRRKPCAVADVLCKPLEQDKLSWFVGQKYFFDPSFGGAVVAGQRNVLDATVLFTGAAFLGRPRDASPVVSRLRLDGSEHTSVEWDADYDTRRGQLIMSNVFADVHEGDWFAGVGHADLLEPHELPAVSDSSTIPSLKLDQIRMLLGYGGPVKPGFSAAANAGYDINLGNVQYGAVQTSYNWSCCGLAVEYRRFALGSVRNENQYRFNLTLAGVGTAGNLRRVERLF